MYLCFSVVSIQSYRCCLQLPLSKQRFDIGIIHMMFHEDRCDAIFVTFIEYSEAISVERATGKVFGFRKRIWMCGS